MADTTALKNRIRAAIKANDNQEITGPVLQQTLLDIVDELDLNPELQEAINTEKNRAQNAERTIDGKASKALSEISNLEIDDVTGTGAQANELSIALKTNEGTEQEPEIVTLDTLILPSATSEKAGLLNAQHKKELCSIKGPNAFVSKATFASGKEWPRANANTNNMSVTAIIVFAYFDGILDYGIMDHANSNSITKIGELSLHEGWNFLNLDSSVVTGQNEYLYVQQNANDSRNSILAGRQASVSSSPNIKAVGLYQGAPNVGSYTDFELCYYCVEDIYTGKAFFEALQQHDRQIVKLLEEDNKNLKLTSEFITTNNRAEDISKYNTINGVRANKFEGDIRGIRVYATVAGIIQYGILAGNDVQLLGTRSITTGWNTILFNSAITCNSNKHIYIKPTTAQIKATNENGVGMYEKIDGSSTIFFEGWELAYHAILSIGIDSYVNALQLQIDSNKELINYIKGPNSLLSDYPSFSSDSTWPRANANTNNCVIKGLIIWAEGDGLVDYGKIDKSNDYATTKIGELSLVNGWNYIVLENTVTTGDTEYLYLQPQTGENVILRLYQDNLETSNNTKAVGIIQGAPNKLSSPNFELRYYIVSDTIANSLPMYIPELYNWNMALQKRIDDNLPPLESVYLSPTTDISQITQYQNADYFRCNNLVPSSGSVKGLRLYVHNYTDGKTLEICLFNTGTMQIDVIKSVILTHEGINDILFDAPITLAQNQRIGLRGLGAQLMSVHNEEGSVGMLQYRYDEPSGQWIYNNFPEWEMSYSLILQQGCNIINEFNNVNKRIDDLELSHIDLKYGEILLPNEIEVARSRQCNLWWDCIANYLIGDKSIYFETHCNIGHNLERGYRIEGNEQAAGNYTLRIVSRKSATREIIDDKTVTIHVVNDTAGSGSKQVLMIGDSRTWHSVATEQGVSYNIEDQGGNKTITTEVKRLVDANAGAVFTFLGTFTSQLDPTVKNLATSGATYLWANSQIGNSIVDFVENQCGGTGLDYVTIMYGINDIEDWNNNQIGQYERSRAKITSVLNNAKALVDKILAGYPNCKIIMVVEPTTCGDQDGFGTWGQTDRDQHLEIEFAQKYLRKKFLEIFDAHEYGNNVYVSSAGIWCDRLYGFPYTKQLQSSRASEKIVEYFRNSVHPHDDGYKQIADGIYSTIKYLESL